MNSSRRKITKFFLVIAAFSPVYGAVIGSFIRDEGIKTITGQLFPLQIILMAFYNNAFLVPAGGLYWASDVATKKQHTNLAAIADVMIVLICTASVIAMMGWGAGVIE